MSALKSRTTTEAPAATPPAEQPDRHVTLVRILACQRWAKHLADEAQGAERTMRTLARRAMRDIEHAEAFAFTALEREALETALVIELTTHAMAGTRQAAAMADHLATLLPDIAAAIAAREGATNGRQ